MHISQNFLRFIFTIIALLKYNKKYIIKIYTIFIKSGFKQKYKKINKWLSKIL